MKSKNPSAAAHEHESSEEFNGLRNTYIERFHPADSVERELVEDMLKARWRHRCLWRRQGAILEMAMEVDTAGETERIALAARYPAELAEICRRTHEKALTILMNRRNSCPPEAA